MRGFQDYGPGYCGGGHMLLWGILGLLILGLLAFLVVSMVRRNRPDTAGGSAYARHPAPEATTSSGSTPVDVVQMRYARGEISKEEYEKLLKDLG